METVHVKAVVQPDGSIHLDDLPFAPGEEVEITMWTPLHSSQLSQKSSLEGTVLKYVDSTLPVAEDDWEAVL